MAANGDSAFAEALARAKQIAAKIQGGSGPVGPMGGTMGGPMGGPMGGGMGGSEFSTGMKRSFDNGSDSQPEAKRQATSNAVGDSGGGPQRAAALAAAAAAAQINAKLGLTGAGVGAAPQMGTGVPDALNSFGSGPQTTEIIFVPDNLVGMCKGGEQIAAIQSETGCRVQFAPEAPGLMQRECTLSGTRQSIEAKEMIQNVIRKGQTGGVPAIGGGGGGGGFGGGGGGQDGYLEIMIPGSKAGLVIGKGGEMIKQLQERCGVKIVVIQDSNAPTAHDKPLRITGERQNCERAKQMILDLLVEKDIETAMIQGKPTGNQTLYEFPIPRTMVGVIIGKGGDMIRKIQEESGSRVQFKPENEPIGPERLCTLVGEPQGNEQAARIIREIIDSAMKMGGAPGGQLDINWGGSGGAGANIDTTYIVPSNKCGLVIGKDHKPAYQAVRWSIHEVHLG